VCFLNGIEAAQARKIMRILFVLFVCLFFWVENKTRRSFRPGKERERKEGRGKKTEGVS
jgi:hypothetical protein